MGAIYSKELKTYFSSATGYIFMGVVTFLAGLFFFTTCIMYDTPDMTAFFSSFQTVVLFIIPVLTMKIWSEEKRQKTDQVLLTAPLGLFQITFAKFLAALTVYAITISITLVYALVLSAIGDIEFLVIFGNVFALLLVGSAMLAIGMFVSNLTESQVVAAVGSFGIVLFLLMIDQLSVIFTNPVVAKAFSLISLFSRYKDFSVGLFNYADVVYYLSIAAIFNFLTVRMLEKRRWS